jgi:beta-N-acetylhexosaminidase
VEESEEALYRVTDDYLALQVGGIMVGVGGRHPRLERGGRIDTGLVRRYTDYLRRRDPDVLVAVDAEGGSIFNLLEGCSPLASGRSYVVAGDRRRYREHLIRHAELLLDLGVNMNFAPLLDVALPGYRGYPAADQRSYSDNPEEVAEYAELFTCVMRDHGIIPVVKHYPGYGALSANPHQTLTSYPRGEEERSLEPYRRLVKAGVPAIMTGHVLTSKDSRWPASLSRRHEDFLREELGFSGVTVADELFMGAITEAMQAAGGGADPRGEHRAVQALTANDMLIVSYPVQNRDGTLRGRPDGKRRFPDMHAAARSALDTGTLDLRRHRQSLARIAGLWNEGGRG